jgi:hypothetical protein
MEDDDGLDWAKRRKKNKRHTKIKDAHILHGIHKVRRRRPVRVIMVTITQERARFL